MAMAPVVERVALARPSPAVVVLRVVGVVDRLQGLHSRSPTKASH